jgi:nitroimidazol reductase NimA-like FMN-containing flavoprotein (pyridoxamine 5'-phosphate oxidase superfamily)
MTEGTDGLLEWPWARKRLTDSHNYLIITVRPDGWPHAMPMHGLWHGDAYYFGTDDDTRKAKNLAENPRCIVVNERFDEATIVEGVAERVPAALLDKETVGMLNAACRKKYGWPMTHGQNSVVWRVSPKVVFAFPLKKIATGVTRWIFP